MKAAERAKQFRERDGSERRLPWALSFFVQEWAAILGVAAVGSGIGAFAGAGGAFWWVAAVCAVGAALGWLLPRSA